METIPPSTNQSPQIKNKPRKTVPHCSSQTFERSQLSQRKTRYVFHDYDKFGSTTPSWTIPSSRHEQLVPETSPPPGQYQLNDQISDKSKIYHTIQARPSTSFKKITADVEVTPSRVFPEIKPKSIGSRYVTSRAAGSDIPPPSYVPPGIGSSNSKGVLIKNRYKEPKKDQTPCVGQYDPHEMPSSNSLLGSFPQQGLYVMPKPHHRPRVDRGTPGPGAYNIVPPVRKVSKWTERYRVHPKSYNPPPVKIYDSTTF